MDDHWIIELYWQRSEEAIGETEKQYGSYCHAIAKSILPDRGDCEECVSDTWLAAWNSIPPERPNHLRAFLGKITRNLALDRFRRATAQKRGNGQVFLALEELQECISADGNLEDRVTEELLLTSLLDRFLAGLSEDNRRIFLRRYWYFSSVQEIARDYALSQSNVKMRLLRTRQELKKTLKEEGILL